MAGIDDPEFEASLFTRATIALLREVIKEEMVKAIPDQLHTEAVHSAYYKADLIAGKRVIVIAHSQGNLFTNEAIRSVILSESDRSDSIGMIGVASPAASRVNQSPYFTAHDDVIINGLRLLRNVLPSNIDNDPGITNDNRNWSNHSFISSYFSSELVSRSRIDEEFWRYIDELPYPEVKAGVGAIRASLTWGAGGDVDLHTFEPNGDHVYYGNKQGQSGELDVDDRNGYGPENYVVGCESVELGTYEIGVNYYSGQTPKTATISLFLGNYETITPRSIQLDLPEGGSGDDNPSILFRVNVEADEEGSIVYTVE